MAIDDVSVSDVPAPTNVPTTSPPTRLPVPSPTPEPTISHQPSPSPTLPNRFDCDFDGDFCSFSNAGGSYAWSRGSSTPSYGTGPQSGDHTSGSGSFAYVESSSPYYPSVGPFILESGTFAQGALFVSFWYNMYGSAMGTLKLDVYDSGTAAWSTSWSLSGNQG